MNAAYIHFNDFGPLDIFNAFEKWGPLTSLSYVIDGANIRLNKKDSHCGQILLSSSKNPKIQKNSKNHKGQIIKKFKKSQKFKNSYFDQDFKEN